MGGGISRHDRDEAMAYDKRWKELVAKHKQDALNIGLMRDGEPYISDEERDQAIGRPPPGWFKIQEELRKKFYGRGVYCTCTRGRGFTSDIKDLAEANIRKAESLINQPAPEWVAQRVRKVRGVLQESVKWAQKTTAERNAEAERIIQSDGHPVVREKQWSAYDTPPTDTEKRFIKMYAISLADWRRFNNQDPSSGVDLRKAGDAIVLFSKLLNGVLDETNAGKAVQGLMKAVEFVGDKVLLGLLPKGAGEFLTKAAQEARKSVLEESGYKQKLKEKEEREQKGEILDEVIKIQQQEGQGRKKGKGFIADAFKFFTGTYQGEKKLKTVLQKHGEAQITSIRLFREPVRGILQKAVNWITKGDLQNQMSKSAYDKLFHLSMYITLSDGASITLEKNQRVTTHLGKYAYGVEAESLPVFSGNGPELRQFIFKAIHRAGPQKFFVYSAFDDRNCQGFVLNALEANGMLTPEISAWVKQDLEEVARRHPVTAQVFQGLTDIAGIVGGGKNAGRSLVSVQRATKGRAKWVATFSDGTTTPFGDKRYEDFTQHGDEKRRKSYLARHKKDLETGDPTRAGFLSYYILWGPSKDISENILAYAKML